MALEEIVGLIRLTIGLMLIVIIVVCMQVSLLVASKLRILKIKRHFGFSRSVILCKQTLYVRNKEIFCKGRTRRVECDFDFAKRFREIALIDFGQAFDISLNFYNYITKNNKIC